MFLELEWKSYKVNYFEDLGVSVLTFACKLIHLMNASSNPINDISRNFQPAPGEQQPYVVKKIVCGCIIFFLINSDFLLSFMVGNAIKHSTIYIYIYLPVFQIPGMEVFL